MLSREFSVTWDCKMTFSREKPILCPKFLVLAGSSSSVLSKLSSQASPCAPGRIPGMVGDPWIPSGEEPGTCSVLEQPVGAMWSSCFHGSSAELL